MGDFRDWWPEPNGPLLEERPSSSSSSSRSSNQTAIGAEFWLRAEEATQGIIAQVQPTVVSGNRRKAVIDYVQRLIRTSLGCEVFPFGSVPLMTYLPDGDIDLSAFGGLNVEEALASDVCSVLEREAHNMASKFVVKDVQLIRAEVKLVKCLVQNIVVDISFNQLGGLCTLCFLEKVLYKFLDYFSKFDWDNYCISLNGPVRLSSLPELVAEIPENDGVDLLLSNDFLKGCLEMFSVPSRGYETNSRTFPPKHLNIVDPLKENNNLGRSVSKGNFYRIRSAFTYGARKLGRILSQPEENTDDEIRQFFSNTLDRHGSGQRPDVQDFMSGHDVFGSALSFSGTDSQEDQMIYDTEYAYLNGKTGECRLGYEGLTHGGFTNTKTLGTSMSFGRAVDEPKRSSVNASASTILVEADDSANKIAVSEYRLSGDAKDLATSRIQGLTISNDASKSPPSSCEDRISPLGKAHHAPHLYFSHTFSGNGDGNSDKKQPENSDYTEKKDLSGLLQAPPEEKAFIAHGDQDENQSVSDNDCLSPVVLKHYPSRLSSAALPSEDLYPNYPGYGMLNGTSGNPEALKSLSDLSGDYDSHVNSLQYGRWCYDYALSTPVTPMPPTLFPQVHGKKPWDAIQRSVQLNGNVYSQGNTNGVVPRSGFYPFNSPILPGGAVFGMEEMPKPRGTGTYFPNTNHYRDRPLSARGRNQAPVRSPRNNGRAMSTPESSWSERSPRNNGHAMSTPESSWSERSPRNNGHAMSTHESNWSERSSRELAQAQFPVYGSGKSESSDHTSGSPGRKVYSNANGSTHPSERVVEFGSVGHLPVEGSLLEKSWQQSSGSALGQNSSGSLPPSGMQSPKPVLGMNQDRIGVQSYRLKDEDDFPPLSG
ncbi:uncharacterized protein LOC132191531 isoform X2 [Corylus avellana]|uniref:uncharacterized protein LOC132191531 isoform X2 n=1 Tax=Corylus avellana TaxID=13451 RepID=UPI00286A49B3|nr:uncharacterized protein LOC132191531 isoform X2 [Corylus avellana]